MSVIPRGNSAMCDECGCTVIPERQANYMGDDEQGNPVYICFECEKEAAENEDDYGIESTANRT